MARTWTQIRAEVVDDNVPRDAAEIDLAAIENTRLTSCEDTRVLIAEVRRLRLETERTEGDLGVAIREATRAREALKTVRPIIVASPRLLPLVDAALDQRLTQ